MMGFGGGRQSSVSRSESWLQWLLLKPSLNYCIKFRCLLHFAIKVCEAREAEADESLGSRPAWSTL